MRVKRTVALHYCMTEQERNLCLLQYESVYSNYCGCEPDIKRQAMAINPNNSRLTITPASIRFLPIVPPVDIRASVVFGGVCHEWGAQFPQDWHSLSPAYTRNPQFSHRSTSTRARVLFNSASTNLLVLAGGLSQRGQEEALVGRISPQRWQFIVPYSIPLEFVCSIFKCNGVT